MNLVESGFVTVIGLGFCVTICVVVIAGHGSTDAIAAAGGIAAFGGTIYAHLRNGYAQARLSQKVDKVAAATDKVAVTTDRAADNAALSVIRTNQTASAIAETQSIVLDRIDEVHKLTNGGTEKRVAEAKAAGIAEGKASALETVVKVLPEVVPVISQSTSASFAVPGTNH